MNLAKKFFKREKKSTFKLLKKSFERHSEELLSELESKHKDTLKWLSKKGIDVGKAVKVGSRGTLATLAAGFVMLSSGLTSKTEPAKPSAEISLGLNQIVESIKSKQALEQKFINSLKDSLPLITRELSEKEADSIAKIISDISGVKVVAELEGNRLNTNYGRIGLEQHLPRYPGETIRDHFDSNLASRYIKSGLTKNRGSFGYFAKDKFSLTPEAIEKEKYYVAVQTFAVEKFDKDKKLQDWYKHRKVMVVNPENGKAVVGVIADSGPAKWTGKSFGGSPELMDHLGLYPEKKAQVLLFFVDNHSNQVELGPL